jgi:hypothetical protein
MKKQLTTTLPRALGVFMLVAAFVVQAAFLPTNSAYASQITTRTLTLLAGDNNTLGINGGSLPGRLVRHKFTFTLPTAASIGAVQFQYCTTAADVGAATCVPPTGLDTTTGTLDGATVGLTGLTVVHDSANVFHVTRAPGATQSLAANTAVTIQLNNIKNPTDVNKTFFVRIASFGSFDATGASTDKGTVAASTTNAIDLSGIMPESLVFCTGKTIGLTAGVPDCTTADLNAITFNQLFSPVDTASATSQMAASTNAGFGYSITVNGPTLTSGSNTILPMNVAAASAHGVSQFGLNLRANTTTTPGFPFGTDVAPVSNTTNYRAKPLAGYDTAETFKYIDGDPVADSSDGGTLGATDAQIYTVSYIANVPGSQPAGTYSTTLTYICTPTY